MAGGTYGNPSPEDPTELYLPFFPHLRITGFRLPGVEVLEGQLMDFQSDEVEKRGDGMVSPVAASRGSLKGFFDLFFRFVVWIK